MIVIITLFYSSLFVIIIMTGWKLVSLRERKLSLIEGVEKEIHSKLYTMMNEWWYVLRTKYLVKARALAISLFYRIAHDILHFVGIWGGKLKERHRKWFDMVKGKGVIHKKGSVSLHLRDISEYKRLRTINNEQQTEENNP
ncbi:MAG: hypothetical protein HY228_00580 [Candidatus Yonathbacteria bacterium]|nr:hypothetical protein [Candidatus Yonathbacteria bacterium]